MPKYMYDLFIIAKSIFKAKFRNMPIRSIEPFINIKNGLYICTSYFWKYKCRIIEVLNAEMPTEF